MSIFAALFRPVTYEVTILFSSDCPSNRMPYKIYDLSISLINFLIMKRFQISLGHCNGGMPHRFGNNTRMNFTVIRSRSPRMSCEVSNI